MQSKLLWSALAVGISCAATAQPPPLPAPPMNQLFVVGDAAPVRAVTGRIDFIRSLGGVPGPVVKDKPYSARSITESTQTLSDGNRITQRNEAVVYRDGEGRTRREQKLAGVGPWQAGEPVTLINIHDPVSGKSYSLDPAARTAREVRAFEMAIAHAGASATGSGQVSAAYAPGTPVPGAPLPAPGSFQNVDVIRLPDGDALQVSRRVFELSPFPPETTGMYDEPEDLGEQVLEGLLVKGTRMTDTIPAGAIGNERPIDIVTERWYSEEIDAMVLERYSDPRVGETSYQLVNVVLGEPPADLFEVPQGYEVEEHLSPSAGVRVMPGPGGAGVQFELQRVEPAQQR